jgi:hypothetical protein
MNKTVKHIAYFTKKLVQEGAKTRPSYIGTRNSFRHNRLLIFKQVLHELINNQK